MLEAGSKVDEKQYLLSSAPAPAQNGSKKRAASSTPPVPSQDKRPKIKEDAKVGDGQNAKSKTIAISIDEYCPLTHYEVYIDPDGTIYDASLNQTNAGANNSKQVLNLQPLMQKLTLFLCRQVLQMPGVLGGCNDSGLC